MLAGDLSAEAVDMVVIAVDAYEASAIDLGGQDLGGFEIGWNQDGCFEAKAGCLGRGCRSTSSRRW